MNDHNTFLVHEKCYKTIKRKQTRCVLNKMSIQKRYSVAELSKNRRSGHQSVIIKEPTFYHFPNVNPIHFLKISTKTAERMTEHIEL